MAKPKKTTSKTAAANKKAAQTKKKIPYKTSTGATQFGTKKDIQNQLESAFNRFRKNPTYKNLALLESLGAMEMAAVSKLFDGWELMDKLEARKLKNARAALKKAKTNGNN